MISSLSLFDFRNYSEKKFTFSEKNVVFFGGNGRGKTNILEAISILSMGKSWRETSPLDLISEGKNSAKIEALTADKDVYQVLIEPRKREFQKNEKKISLKKHMGQIPTLLFVPEHLFLFSDVRRKRQNFFDRFLSQTNSSYRETLLHCARAMKQKNTLLRQEDFEASRDRGQMETWNEILAQDVPKILRTRREFLKEFNPLFTQALARISGASDLGEVKLEVCELEEETSEGVKDFFRRHHARECAARRCLIGPHRDDFSFFLREKPILQTASRGEERSVILAVLAAEKHLLKEKLGTSPILLLDDVFSELDQSRQDFLENLCNESQIFFTTTHESHFEKFSHPVERIEIEKTIFNLQSSITNK